MENWREELYKQYTTNKGRSKTISKLSDCAFYKKKIKIHLPHDRTKKILDLAAGHGDLLNCLKNDGYKNIKGIDFSEEEVKTGNSMGIKNLSQENIFDFLKNTTEKFDIVFLMDILEHLERKELFEILSKIKKVLNPKGIIIIQVPNAEGIFGMRIRYGDLTHENAFTQNSLLQALTKTGMKDIKFYEVSPIKKGIKGILRFILWHILVFPFRVIFFLETGIKKIILSQNIIVKAEN